MARRSCGALVRLGGVGDVGKRHDLWDDEVGPGSTAFVGDLASEGLGGVRWHEEDGRSLRGYALDDDHLLSGLTYRCADHPLHREGCGMTWGWICCGVRFLWGPCA